MMSKTFVSSLFWRCLFGAVLLQGCAAPTAKQTRFYRLNPVQETATEPSLAGQAELQPRLGLGPVQLAGYLDRSQLITRNGPYRLVLNDFDHWAGSLQDNIKAGLVDALQSRLGGDLVIGYPWHSAVQPDYQLLLDVGRFDAQDQALILRVRWSLLKGRGDELLAVRRVTLREPMGSDQPQAMVAAASRALDRLAEQLAAVIRDYP